MAEILPEDFTAPLRRSLVEPILLAGAPRTLAMVNGTLAAALGLGLRLSLAGLQLRLDLAHTLKPGLQTGSHEQHLHLNATYSFP